MTERLREIEQRCEKATPGPWVAEPDDNGEVWWGMDPDASEIRVCACRSTDRRQRNQDNAYFIANAREDIPYLLSVIKEQADTIQELTGMLEDEGVL